MIKSTKKPLAAALGTAFLASAIVPAASADVANPFTANELSSSYEQVGQMGRNKDEGSCGEGKCGDKKASSEEGSCGEGKCGDKKASSEEGSCGEGKCGDSK